jgi:hypothetical protein
LLLPRNRVLDSYIWVQKHFELIYLLSPFWIVDEGFLIIVIQSLNLLLVSNRLTLKWAHLNAPKNLLRKSCSKR